MCRKVCIIVETMEKANPMMPVDESKLMYHGTIEKKGTGLLLRYEDNVEDDEGGNGSTQVSIHFTPTRVMMSRKGNYSTNLVFERKRYYEGWYNTPYGEMRLSTQTCELITEIQEDNGHIHIEYQIYLSGGDPVFRIVNIYYGEEKKDTDALSF